MTNTQLAPITKARDQLAKMSTELAKVLPEHVTFERFERVVATALQRDDKLLSANRKSLFEAVTQCATDGLVPDGREAALVIFGGKVAYMPMVRGVIKRIQQSGDLVTLTSQVIYEGDQFDTWTDDDGDHILHKKDLLGDRGKPIGVFALAKTKSGGRYIEVMSLSEIEKVRKVSRSGSSGPWRDWWDEMARKTVIRRLSKRLPMSNEAEQVIRRDDHMYDLGSVTPTRVTTAPSAAASLQALAAPEEGPETPDNETDVEQDIDDGFIDAEYEENEEF